MERTSNNMPSLLVLLLLLLLLVPRHVLCLNQTKCTIWEETGVQAGETKVIWDINEPESEYLHRLLYVRAGVGFEGVRLTVTDRETGDEGNRTVTHSLFLNARDRDLDRDTWTEVKVWVLANVRDDRLDLYVGQHEKGCTTDTGKTATYSRPQIIARRVKVTAHGTSTWKRHTGRDCEYSPTKYPFPEPPLPTCALQFAPPPPPLTPSEVVVVSVIAVLVEVTGMMAVVVVVYIHLRDYSMLLGGAAAGGGGGGGAGGGGTVQVNRLPRQTQ